MITAQQGGDNIAVSFIKKQKTKAPPLSCDPLNDKTEHFEIIPVVRQFCRACRRGFQIQLDAECRGSRLPPEVDWIVTMTYTGR